MNRPDLLDQLEQLACSARGRAPPPAYAELHCLTNFSFLRGASSARELVERAHRLGYAALAITDECSMAGIVRAHEAGKALGLKLIYGTELKLGDGPRVVLLARDLRGYQNICQLITLGRRAADKGEYHLTRADLAGNARDGVLALLLPAFAVRGVEHEIAPVKAKSAKARAGKARVDAPDAPPRLGKVTVKRVLDAVANETPEHLPEGLPEDLRWLRDLFDERLWLAVELHRGARDAPRLRALLDLATRENVRAVACGDVHMHARRRKALQDTLVAIRERTTLVEAGFALFPNGERHLRARDDLADIYPEELLAESVRIARSCTFALEQLHYVYPREIVPAGKTAPGHLRELTELGLKWRWPAGVPANVREQVEKELGLIGELRYEHFFLTVHDVVRYARSRAILCQGRGSAANSAVCYALGITEVDPARNNLLFERFISRERNEPPDIDVDFEHERREEVIQYIYGKYGRQRAALAATVISYQPRSAVRDVGKALGLAGDQLEQLSSALGGWSGLDDLRGRLADYGFDPDSAVIGRLMRLSEELIDFPRHLSQHVGGFVISDQPLHELVPVENAAMEDRTIIQWDKDDLETLGLLKVDCLALGMLSCLRRCFELMRIHRALDYTMATLPAEDAQTYAMIQRADTIGVFQIESRAQMSMLPRLRPENFYDLVIEVAIVRPGPIQGGMVHPYLRRRQKLEPVIYEKPELKKVFERTLGVPIFQEQVMQLVIVAADFAPGEADQLRRSMAAWKRRGDLRQYQERITAGMLNNGYSAEFAAQICEQIKGFGSYGFPESHAASFALLVYVSSWVKCHQPAVFACALINSQPMGFYQPSQIVQDLRRHGVEARPVDVTLSDWDCTLEPDERREGALALRLGFRLVQGISAECAGRMVGARAERAFADVQDLVDRAQLTRFERARLAEGGVLHRLAGHRHRAHWAVAGAEPLPAVLEGSAIGEQRVSLKPPSAHHNVMADYAFVGLSLSGHPLGLIRKLLRARRARSARELAALANGARTRAAGVVTVRQSPQTATGVTFVTLEDETGSVNVVVWRALAERQRRELVDSTVLAIDGEMQVAQGVRHLVAHRLYDWSELSRELHSQSRDFH